MSSDSARVKSRVIDGPRDSQVTPVLIERAANDAVAYYGEHCILDDDQRERLKFDFVEFYDIVSRQNRPGIVWNFNGCIFCGVADGDTAFKTALVGDFELNRITGGRSVGVIICSDDMQELERFHRPIVQLIPAITARLQRDPIA